MKRYAWCASLLIFSSSVWADISLEPLLDKVTLQLQAEQWVTTQTALVTVGVNAAVSDQAIEKIQSNVMQKLNQLAPSNDWHIVSFNRQQDKSGLESIFITAQARLPQSALGNLRDKAKAMSRPGETYTIDNVQFTPSEEEIRAANTALRNNIYRQAKAEIEALNNAYPDQKYYLHSIDFIPILPMPMENIGLMANKVSFGGAAPRAVPPLNIGNKTQMQATVVLASMPSVVGQRLGQKSEP